MGVNTTTILKNEKNNIHATHRTNKCQLGPDFVAPDGGWGWLVCAAAGCSNLCSFALLQQFGLLFRDRLNLLGMLNSEITTIINLQACVTSCMGLLNGPMFRFFTYRQVAFWSALLFSIGVFFTSMSYSFTTYVLTFSVLYGIGSGINASANSLALNTYFQEKRRIATGCSWTLTALGPIIFPQIIALLLPYYGVQGTVMLFSALSLNAVALSLLYQPVQWHIKPPAVHVEIGKLNHEKCAYCRLMTSKKSHSLFSSQYLYNSDNHSIAGYEIIDPATPMMSRANDGWYCGKTSNYGSKLSLTSTRMNSRIGSSQNLGSLADRPSCVNLLSLNKDSIKDPAKIDAGLNTANVAARTTNAKSTNLSKEEKREKRKEISERIKIDEAPTEDCDSHKAPHDINENVGQKSQRVKLEIPLVFPNTVDAKPSNRLNYIDRDGEWEQQTLLESGRAASVENDWKPQAEDLCTNGTSGTIQQQPIKLSTNSFQSEKELLNGVTKKLEQYTSLGISKFDLEFYCTCSETKESSNYVQTNSKQMVDDHERDRENYTLLQKILIFFDLDLLKDLTYVNLMIGVTIAGFAELNYSILTPFVLSEYEFTKRQIATVMSLLGAMDISVRFFVPFIAGKIGWDNKTFFLVGIMGMALGRISIAHFHSYYSVLIASCWIGLNKGLRTVFMALVIPSYVPLDRLPGASGLQLVFAGIFYFLMGPVIGWIRDTTNYTVTLHCLNIATYLTCISWTLQTFFNRRRQPQQNIV